MIGNIAESKKCLESLLSINSESKEKSEAEKQSDAALKLGLLEYENHCLDKAVVYMEKHFETVKSFKDKKIVNLSRVNYGIAKAEMAMSIVNQQTNLRR